MNKLAYYELKAAEALFRKHRGALDEAESNRVHKVARRFAEIELAVLGSTQARGVCLHDGAVAAALAEIRARYADDEAYEIALGEAGLDDDRLAAALQRDLLVDAVLDRVGARVEPVGETEAEIFYYSHLDRFQSPASRSARHILITINDDLPDNDRAAARRRIDEIARRLHAKPHRFEEQALKHSECPTALNGGALGDVRRGQLYPHLDQALFELQENRISAVVESELGFHLLRCDRINPACTLCFAEVADALRQRLTEERARRASRQWLEALLATPGQSSATTAAMTSPIAEAASVVSDRQ